MDHQVFDSLVSDMLRMSLVTPHVLDCREREVNPKRLGAYFPSNLSFEENWGSEDDDSTWEFSASIPPSPSTASFYTASETFYTEETTPAQEIARLYRTKAETSASADTAEAPLSSDAPEADHALHGSKRSGVYLPTRLDMVSRWEDAADVDDWEPISPLYPPSSSSYSFHTGSITECNPEEEEELIVRSHSRTSASLDRSETRSSSSKTLYSDHMSSHRRHSLKDVDDSNSDFFDQKGRQEERRAIYRQSRLEALQANLKEAVTVMECSRTSGHEMLVCPRADCGDTMSDVKALMYHLNIHDVANMVMFSDVKLRRSNLAPPHQKNPLTTPVTLRASLRRALRRLGSRN
ncbi:hypothetical protein BDN72DRAFT_839743 [Pluteus cervinus]|uniref:Uncharacterized protein n=1 Tax=Pluteus cervinus TaxID=181527 RepID=A0ACD3AX89_9AGAR|nr:hypothetical protein BDN72DRAFT_839743 [Pluteus cervinus]